MVTGSAVIAAKRLAIHARRRRFRRPTEASANAMVGRDLTSTRHNEPPARRSIRSASNRPIMARNTTVLRPRDRLRKIQHAGPVGNWTLAASPANGRQKKSGFALFTLVATRW